MKKMFILAMLVLGTGLAQAQWAVEANSGATFSNGDGKITSTGDSLSDAFSAQAAVSYDFFMDSMFNLAPEVRGAVTKGKVSFQPGVNVGHDNLYAKVNYNTQKGYEEVIYGLAAEADLSMMSKGLSFIPMVQYGQDSHVYTVTAGLKYKF